MNNKQAGLQNEQVKSTGLESLEQAPANERAASTSSPKISQNRPTRPWKKQAILLLVVMFFVSGLGLAALRLAGKVKNASKNQSTIDAYNTVQNPVLGDDTLLPVQSLNDQTVTINGDLTVQGKLNLSAQALNDLASILGNTVSLSPVLGGPAQVGNINISGGVAAASFQGSGAALTNLNASNITEGTLSNERLDGSVTRLGQTIPLSALQSTVLSSLNGISNNGSASIVGSGSVSISTDVNTGTITVTGAAGGINGVIAGTGLTGGGVSGTVTLDVDSGVVTMQGNTFNGTNQLVKLNGAGELPVISATNLTNLNASNISSGTVSDSRLSANVTMQGNTFNGTNQLVKLNGAGELPVISATNLTNLNASNIGAGTLADARLGANVTLQGNTFNLANKLVKLDNSGNLPALSGAALTNLNASNISAGTLADGRLSANVALLNANQTFTGNVVFSQPLTVNVIQPSASMVIGATNQSLTLQGDLTTKLTATSGSGTVSLGFTGTPTGNVIYNLDAATSPGTYTLCTTVGNCASAGGGVTTLGGNTNKLAKFTGSQSIGDSSISDTGSLVTIGASGLYKAGADSTTAFRVQNAAGSTNVFTVDSTNTRVAIGQATAGYTLDVNGDINSATGLRVGGNLVCDASGCAASAGANFYIQNGTSLQTGANFNIESTATTSPTVVLKAKTSQTANLLQATDASNNVIAKIDASGNISTTGQFQVNGTQISSANLSNDSNIAKLNGAQTFSAANLFKNATDSTTAFQIQNAAASNLFVADTTNTRIAIGQATAGYTLDVNGDINIAAGNSFRINGVAICGPTATCAPSSGSNNYIQNGLTTQTANLNIQSASSSSVVAVVQGATGQTADLLQARDQNNDVVAKITSTGAIYQGSNQVCDTSNNCGYAIGSGSNNYIQNGTSTQTANMNIKSADANSVTATIQGSTAQVADILQVTSGGGSTLLGVSQNTTNIITNPSFDVDTSGWSALGNASIARSTTDQYIGLGSLLVTTTAAANDGARYNYQFAASTSYAVSFYSRVNTTQWGSMQITFTNDGTTQSNCVNNQVVLVGGWTRYTCSFTTSASVSGTRFIGIRQTDATARSFYVDAVQVEPGTTTTAFQQGTIALNGVVNSPVVIRTQSNSNTAFSLQNATGTNIFSLSNTGNGGATVSNGFALSSVGSMSVTAAAASALTVSGGGAFSQYANSNVYNGGSLTVGDTTQNATPLIVNPSAGTNLFGTVSNFDTGTGGVSALGSATLTRSTAEQYAGIGSLRIATTAAANDGVRQIWTNLALNTTYTLSVYAKASGSSFSTFEMGYTDNTTFTSCLTGQTVSSAVWQRYTCTFTTPASVVRNVYYRQTDAISRVFFVDAMQIEIGSTLTPYQEATLSFSGMFTSPAVFRNQSDTTTAFQIQNNAGTSNLFVADTYNNRVAIGKATASYTLDVAGDINSTTALRVGGNQVCDSTGCTVSSSANNVIKNQTTTQTANMNIQSANAANVTAVIQGAGAQTADILQVKDGTAQATPIFSVNQVTPNLIDNSGFDTDTSGWTALGSSTFSQITSPTFVGDGALSFSGTTASDGVKYTYALASNTTYTLSYYGRYTAGWTNAYTGRSENGSTNTDCNNHNWNIPANTWSRMTCTFTTGTVSGSTYLYIRHSGPMYIDGVQLELGSVATEYQPGQIDLNGVISSSLRLRNATDSQRALSIQNAAGADQMSFNTSTGVLCVGPCTSANITGGAGANSYLGAASLQLGPGSTGTLSVGSGGYGNVFAVNSGTSNVVAIQQFTQDANKVGLMVQGFSGVQTTDILQVKGGNTVNNILSVSQNNSNLIVNPSFDTNTTGWTNLNSTSFARTTAETYSGPAGLAVGPTAATGDGVRQSYSLATSTTYTFSFYAKGASAFSTLEAGYVVGSTYTSCATAQAVTTGWNRISCTFTTPGSWGGTPSLYVRQTDATARTFYLDAFQLETGSTPTNYSLGNISLNGTINSPATFRNQSNSTSAFQIQNATGTPQLTFDTTSTGALNIFNSSNRALTISNNKISNNANVLQLEATAGNTVEVVNSGSSDSFPAFKVTGSAAAAVQAQIKGAAAQTADIFQVQGGNTSNNVFTVRQNNANLLTNPSFDVNINGWTAFTGDTISRTTTDQYSGNGSLSNVTTASANAGAFATFALAANTQYSFSVYARASGSNFSTFQMGYTNDGSTNTSCLTGQTVSTTGWTRYTCTFVTSASVSGTRYVYYRQTDATARTFFVDAAQLEISSAATLFNLGSINFNGVINSPTTFQNQSNSVDAFRINNATGIPIFAIDTTTGAVSLGSTSGESGTMNISTGTGTLTINIGTGGIGGKTINIGTGAVANAITIGNTSSSTVLVRAGNYYSVDGGSIYMNACNSCLMQIGLNGWQQYISIGNSSGNTSLATNSGTGGTSLTSTGAVNITTGGSYGGTFSFGGAGLYLQSTGNVVLGGNTSTAQISLAPNLSSGKLELGGSSSNAMTGNIDIGVGNGAQTLNFGTGAAAKTINIGGITTTTNISLKVGATGTNGVTVLTGKTSGTQNLFTFTDGSGDNLGSISIDTTANTTTYNTTSDKRLKENISETRYTLDDLLQISVADYSFITDSTHRTQTGFLAQDLYAIFPDAVKVGGSDPSTDPWAVDYGRLTPLIVKSVQQLNTKVDRLSARVDVLQLSQAAWSGGIVGQTTEFQNLVSFDSFVTFKDKVTFRSDVAFDGRVTFADKDLAGIVTMKAGTKTAHVSFTRPYIEAPIVTVSPKDSAAGYAVKNVQADGFDITVPSNAPADIDFNWIALSVKQSP